MASQISSKAEVSPRAKIGDNCKIFPFVYIEDDVVIGDGCIIFPFVSILNGTRMGNNNKVHQGAVVGARGCAYKNVEPWTVVGGNPAHVIKRRIIKQEPTD